MTGHNLFFLTKVGQVIVTEYGHPKLSDGSLYYYADQYWCEKLLAGKDEFGRNETDRLFVTLCNTLFVYLSGKEERFKSLVCKNIEGIYHVCVELMGDIVEGELSHVIVVFEERAKGNGGK